MICSPTIGMVTTLVWITPPCSRCVRTLILYIRTTVCCLTVSLCARRCSPTTRSCCTRKTTWPRGSLWRLAPPLHSRPAGSNTAHVAAELKALEGSVHTSRFNPPPFPASAETLRFALDVILPSTGQKTSQLPEITAYITPLIMYVRADGSHCSRILNPANFCTLDLQVCLCVSLQLLGELLLDRHNFTVMTRYISKAENLKLMMNLLRDKSPNIQFEAFHVFKVAGVNWGVSVNNEFSRDSVTPSRASRVEALWLVFTDPDTELWRRLFLLFKLLNVFQICHILHSKLVSMLVSVLVSVVCSLKCNLINYRNFIWLI